MRNLIIKREKSFVACLAPIQIYIEDYQYSDTTINNVPCRKLGKIKNGETVSFQIEDNAAKVFAIGDKLSKGICSEFFQLYEGQGDIYLTGKNKYNPANGNAFRFDNNNNEEALKNRKTTTRKGVILLVVCAIIGGVIGFFQGWTEEPDYEPVEKVFECRDMTITLTDEFEIVKQPGFTCCYGSNDVAVFVLEEMFTQYEGLEDYTLEEYGELVLEANGITDKNELKSLDGIPYFTFKGDDASGTEDYTYHAYLYKEDDAFWVVQFAVYTEQLAEYQDEFVEWAKSVTFS